MPKPGWSLDVTSGVMPIGLDCLDHTDTETLFGTVIKLTGGARHGETCENAGVGTDMHCGQAHSR